MTWVRDPDRPGHGADTTRNQPPAISTQPRLTRSHTLESLGQLSVQPMGPGPEGRRARQPRDRIARLTYLPLLQRESRRRPSQPLAVPLSLVAFPPPPIFHRYRPSAEVIRQRRRWPISKSRFFSTNVAPPLVTRKRNYAKRHNFTGFLQSRTFIFMWTSGTSGEAK